MKTTKATVKETEMLTADVLRVRFTAESEFTLKPGQFINIKIEDDQPGMCFRAYSVASGVNDAPDIEIVVKLLESGRGSAFLKGLTSGSAVEFIGPIGHFTHARKSSKDVFIATGTGVVPYLSFLASLADEDANRPMHLLWGLRHEDDIFMDDFFAQCSEDCDNFTYNYALTRSEKQGDAIVHGRVTSDTVLDTITDFSDTDFYICGNPAMVDAIETILKDKGVSEECIYLEKY